MLEEISIKNIVLIKSANLPFQKGFTAITGETGAGKSVLLTSLELICGQRSSASVIRTNEDKAQIVASFNVPPHHPTRQLLIEKDIELDESEPLIVRRTINRSGRSQIWMADTPVNLSFMRGVAASLIEIQGQHAQMELTEEGRHRRYLDQFGIDKTLLANVAHAFEEWQNLKAQYQEKEEKLAKSQREEAYLRHSDEELDKLAIQEGEEEELAQERTQLKQKEKQGEAAASAYAELTAQSSPTPPVSSIISKVARHLEGPGMEESEDSEFGAILTYIHKAQDNLAEAESLLDGFLTSHGSSTQELDDIEGRLFKIREIARKYRIQGDEIPQFHKDIKEQLHLLENADQDFQELERKLKEAYEHYLNQAKKLHDERLSCAQKMCAAITKELKPLGLGKALFKIDITEKELAHYNEHGIDNIRFLIATNPGQTPSPLSKTVSGGELSRIALALRVLSKDEKSTKTLVFDEIDTGIGGATAGAIGERLRQLGRSHQVIAVTHNPQVAALAHSQFCLKKTSHDHETITHITKLDHSQRIEEIARMLSADKITDAARAAAKSLLQDN